MIYRKLCNGTTLSALLLALAVTQGQAQGLLTYLPSNAFGASKASWVLWPEVIAATSVAGSYGLRSLLGTASQSLTNVETHPAKKLDYYWDVAAPLTLCSKKTFQLLALPSEPGPSLTISEPHLKEQGSYCVQVTPTAPEGGASLYFNSDGGQIDFNRSTLTLNARSTPLAQLKPVSAGTPLQGNHLTLTSSIIEGLDPSLNTPVRLDGSHPVGRQVPNGTEKEKGSGGDGDQKQASSHDAPEDTDGAVGGGSGTGGGGASAGGNGDNPKKPAKKDGLAPEVIQYVLSMTERIATEILEKTSEFIASQDQSIPMTSRDAENIDDFIHQQTIEIVDRETSQKGIQNVKAVIFLKVQQILENRFR